MTLSEFLNVLRILRSIDRGELADAGIKLDDRNWLDFQRDPYQWICLASSLGAAELWLIVRNRMPKKKERDHGEI